MHQLQSSPAEGLLLTHCMWNRALSVDPLTAYYHFLTLQKYCYNDAVTLLLGILVRVAFSQALSIVHSSSTPRHLLPIA